MNVFVKKQNKKIIVILSIIMLFMVGIPIFSLAVDNTAPEVSVDKRGRIKVGTDITYTITDDSTISAIYYAWDRHNGGEMQVLSNLNLIAPYSKTIKLPFNDKQLGTHEFSIAALDSNGNIGNWLDVAYNVINEDVPENYVDDDKVKFIIDTQSGAYPVSRSTINLKTPVTIGMKDDNGIYVLAYKWVKNLCNDYDYEYNLEKYYNKDTKIYTYTFYAPTEPGEWYIQFFCIDGSGLTSDLCWSKYTVKDTEAPKLTLKDGKSEVEVLINSEYKDTGAVWTDNDPKASSGEVLATKTLDTSKEGTQVLEYTYTDDGGNTTTITRTVHVVNPVSKIEMATLPKVQYTYGETIDVTNGKVKIIHLSGKETQIDLTKEMLTKYDEHQTGSQNVEVSYTDNKNVVHKTEFEININIPKPETVSATYGDKLLNVKLQAGFTIDENQYNEEVVLNEIGTKEFLAIYTPTNTSFAPIPTKATINVLAKAINNKNITVNILSSINEGDTLIYNTREQIPQITKVTLLENGKTTELDASKDYTISILYATKNTSGKYGEYVEAKPINAGTYKAKIVITGTKNYSNEVTKIIEYTITDKCIVTFYDGDKILGTHRDIVVGTSIPTNKIPNTNKEGTETIAYKFIGWYKNPELTEQFDIENEVITTNTNIYAKYDKLEGEAYTVIFEVEGKTVKTVKSIIANDYKVELPANPSKTGHTFSGWFYTVNETEKEVTTNTQIKDNVTVVAKFTPNKYTVTLELNDGTLPQGTNITEYTYGTETTLPTPTKTGYTFKGWFNNSACTGTAVTKIGATETENKTYYAKFEKDTYTITYNKNEGTIKDTNYAETYKYGDIVTLPTNVTKTGYTFEGWFVNAEFTGTAVTEITSTDIGNKTYFAKWTPNANTAYTVEHYKQNMDLKGYSKVDTENLTGTTNTKATATAKTYNGFTLNLDVAGTVKEGTIAADGKLVLKLYYNRNTYTVTLNANNGTQATIQSIVYEGKAQKPANPEKQADDQYTYAFANWYTTENFEQGTEYNFNTPITQNVTLYAKYNKTAKEYNVTLNLDNGILAQGSNITKYTFGTETTLPIPTKTGYTFAGWFVNVEDTETAVTKIGATETGDKTYFAKWTANANTAYTVEHYTQNVDLKTYSKVTSETESLTGTTGTTVTATAKTINGFTLNLDVAETVKEGTVAANGSLVLKLYYNRNKYKVTLDANGGTITDNVTEVEYIYGKDTTLPTPTKTGYTFAGWFYTVNEAETEFTATTQITEATQVTAKWTANANTAYTVKHYKQTADLTGYDTVNAEVENLTGTTGAEITVTPKTTYEGYAPKQNNVLTGTISADGSLVIEVYYDLVIYTVTFNADGVQPVQKTTDVTKGYKVELPANPSKTGHTFTGWFTSDNKQITAETAIKENITAIAHFTINQYTVTFNANNGTQATTQSINYNDTATKPTNPEKTADAQYTYTFAGWYTTQNFVEGTEYNFETPVTQDVTLYARYDTTANEYKVTLNTNGGTIANGKDITKYTFGIGATLPIEIEKEGYIFAGWFNDAKFTGTSVTEITSTETGDKTYYAKWVALPKNLKATYEDKLFSIQLPEDFEFDKTEYNENTTVGNAGTNEFSVVYKPLNKTGIKVKVAVSQKAISAESITVNVETNIKSGEKIVYDGTPKATEATKVTLVEGEKTTQLAETTDYTVSVLYAKKDVKKEDGTLTYGDYSETKPQTPGSYKAKIVITGTGNYTKSISKVIYYTITAKILTVDNTTIETNITSGEKIVYDGTPKATEVTKVTFTEGETVTQLHETTDYTVSILYAKKDVKKEDGTLTYGDYSETKPLGVGTYKIRVVITGTGNYAKTVSKTLTCTITAKPLTKDNITIETNITSGEKIVYDGTPKATEVTKVTLIEGEKKTQLAETTEYTASVLYAKKDVKKEDGTLTYGDYSEVKPEGAGSYKARIIITGANNYSKSVSQVIYYTITPKVITKDNISIETNIVSGDKLIYAEGTKQSVEVTKVTLIEGEKKTELANTSDYTVSVEYAKKDVKKEDGTLTFGNYSDEKPENAGSYKARIIITGANNYSKSVSQVIYYTIVGRYSVIFKVEDETLTTLIAEEKNKFKVNVPQAPEKTGYTFVGWFTENNEKFTSDTVVSANTTLKAKYNPNEYKVTLNVNGGELAEGANITKYTYGTETTLPTPTRVGYTFAGWFMGTETEATEKITSTDIGNKEFSAAWTPNADTAYTVEYYKQNLDGTYSVAKTVSATGTTDTKATATEETFNGFALNLDVDGTVAEGNIAADGSLVLKLYYDRNKYKVTLNVNGGALAEGTNITEYTYGTETTLPIPEKLGYSFDGWFNGTETEAATKITETDIGNKEFSAKWTPNADTAYTVNHYKQNLDGTYSLAETIPATGTTDTKATATEKVYDGFTLNPDATGTVAEGNIAADGSLVLKLYYDRNKYEITLNANGGTIADNVTEVEYVYGKDTTLPEPEKEGYTFEGWFYTLNGTETEFTATTQITEATTVTAKWEIKTYTVTFNAGEGTVTPETTNVNHGGTISSLPTPTREGYTFEGWFVNDTTEFTTETPIINDITVTAKWEIKTYTVTFDAGEGSVEQETATANYGGTISSLPTPTREGYTFEGWFVNDTTEFTTETPVTNDITVTAKWEIKTYTVTFKAEGAEDVQKTTNVTKGYKVILPEAPTKPGNTFAGWFYTLDGTIKEFTAETVVTGNITVTAEFTENIVITKIEVENPPKAVKYGSDLKFSLTVTMNKGTTTTTTYVDSTKCTITGYDNQKVLEKQTVTVTYEGKTTTFDVMVEDGVTGIEVINNGKKVYNLGETIDTSGIVVTTIMASGKEGTDVTKDSNIPQERVTMKGNMPIKVTYGKFEKVITVQVNEANISYAEITENGEGAKRTLESAAKLTTAIALYWNEGINGELNGEEVDSGVKIEKYGEYKIVVGGTTITFSIVKPEIETIDNYYTIKDNNDGTYTFNIKQQDKIMKIQLITSTGELLAFGEGEGMTIQDFDNYSKVSESGEYTIIITTTAGKTFDDTITIPE